MAPLPPMTYALVAPSLCTASAAASDSPKRSVSTMGAFKAPARPVALMASAKSSSRATTTHSLPSGNASSATAAEVSAAPSPARRLTEAGSSRWKRARYRSLPVARTVKTSPPSTASPIKSPSSVDPISRSHPMNFMPSCAIAWSTVLPPFTTSPPPHASPPAPATTEMLTFSKSSPHTTEPACASSPVASSTSTQSVATPSACASSANESPLSSAIPR